MIRPAKPAIALFLFAFLCGLIQLPLHLDAVGFGSPYEAATVARNLAATGQFRDPFGVPTGPTAHVPPLYPFVLALLIRVLRQAPAIIWATVILNCVLMGLAAALLPSLSQRIYGRAGPGIAGGILLALTGRLMPQWEVALASALLLAAALAISDRNAVRAGIWSGACLLTNPVSAPMLAVLGLAKGRRFAAIAGLLAIALCVPWILRNWAALGTPYFIRDNLGLELYISNNDHAAPALIDNTALWTRHPNQNHIEAAVVGRMGEGPYNHMRLANALDWIGDHPLQFLGLTAGRARNYWFPTFREGWPAYGAWLITVLALLGVWLARGHAGSLPIAAAALAYSLPYLFIQTVGRYRYPSLWASALFAGYAIDRLAAACAVRLPSRACEQAGL